MMEKQKTEKKKKFHLPPIVLVILSGIIMICCIIISIHVTNANKENREFMKDANKAEAYVRNKTAYTIGTDDEYVIHYNLEIAFNTSKYTDEKNFVTVIDVTSEAFKDIEPGMTIDVYFHEDNPSDCRPAILFTDNTMIYIILVIGFIFAIAMAWLNLDTIIRNIHGYAPRFAKPEEIGFMGDPNVDNGLSDNSIDYSAGDVFSNNIMDSYSDPFATYSGYEEGQNGSFNESYYDPNASYNSSQPEAPDGYIDHGGADLNNPFVTSADTDPNNPYNQGNYNN